MPSPIGHCLMGCSLYADRPAEAGRNWWSLAALVFFANAPDLDFIPGLLVGNPQLLHRMATHSLVSPVILAAVAALAFSWRGRAAALGAARLVFFAVLSHVVLDYFCAGAPQHGPMLFWPLSESRFAASPALFPLVSDKNIMSWGNVVAVIGEAAIVSVILLTALFRRSMRGMGRTRVAGTAYPLAEASE